MSSANFWKTTGLLLALTGLLLLAGSAIAGTTGVIIALVFGLVMHFGTYWFSDRIALATSGAQEVSTTEAPELHYAVEALARRAGIPKPRVYVIPSDSPNAFATGRDPAHAAVAVTSGIMNALSRSELEGVLAHELAHIRNRDTLTMTVTATIAGAITMIATMAQWALIFGGFGGRDDEDDGIAGLVFGVIMIILAPIAATFIQLAISRAREYEADATGARISGSPLALASALERLETAVAHRPMQVAPSRAHLYIVNPLGGRGFENLFRTHPTTAERVTRLRDLQRSLAQAAG